MPNILNTHTQSVKRIPYSHAHMLTHIPPPPAVHHAGCEPQEPQ